MFLLVSVFFCIEYGELGRWRHGWPPLTSTSQFTDGESLLSFDTNQLCGRGASLEWWLVAVLCSVLLVVVGCGWPGAGGSNTQHFPTPTHRRPPTAPTTAIIVISASRHKTLDVALLRKTFDSYADTSQVEGGEGGLSDTAERDSNAHRFGAAGGTIAMHEFTDSMAKLGYKRLLIRGEGQRSSSNDAHVAGASALDRASDGSDPGGEDGGEGEEVEDSDAPPPSVASVASLRGNSGMSIAAAMPTAVASVMRRGAAGLHPFAHEAAFKRYCQSGNMTFSEYQTCIASLFYSTDPTTVLREPYGGWWRGRRLTPVDSKHHHTLSLSFIV